MFRNINPNFAIILSTLLWGTWWFPLRLLNESANNNAIPLTLSFLIAGLFLLCFSLKNIHLLSKRNIMLTLVAATMGAAAMCLYNEGLLRGNVARILIFFYLTAVWSTIIEIVFLKVPLTVSRALSITAGFIGLFIITGLDKGNFLPNSLADIFGIFSGSFIWWLALCSISIKFKERLTPRLIRKINLISGGLIFIFGILLVISIKGI